ncbi:MAG TPA: copper-binding protein [Telluria sp.]|nr:copper-binding protein [Telluria sp.]
MNAISKLALATLIAASSASPAFAQDAHAGHGSHGAAAHGSHQAAAAAELTTGEIKKVDKDAGKLTIRHGELKNLNMPAMTMVFRVKDTAMLSQVKAGDKVKFSAEKVDGAITVTKLENVK